MLSVRSNIPGFVKSAVGSINAWIDVTNPKRCGAAFPGAFDLPRSIWGGVEAPWTLAICKKLKSNKKGDVKMKEMLKRALRTFLQAALGYVAANIVYIVSSSPDNFDYMKNTVMGLVISAAAAGLSAVMNIPRKSKDCSCKEDGDPEPDTAKEETDGLNARSDLTDTDTPDDSESGDA